MKNNLIKNAHYLILITAILFTACKKGGDDPDPKDEKIGELSATWNVTEITAGAEDIDLTGVTTAITFTTAKSYTISNFSGWETLNLNNSEVLKASGTYDLNSTLDVVVLDGIAENKLTLITLSDTALKFSYASNYPKPASDAQTITVTASR